MPIVWNWNSRIRIINRRDYSDFPAVGVIRTLALVHVEDEFLGMLFTMELRQLDYVDISSGFTATRSASIGHPMMVFTETIFLII
jgi:hypothetical protein